MGKAFKMHGLAFVNILNFKKRLFSLTFGCDCIFFPISGLESALELLVNGIQFVKPAGLFCCFVTLEIALFMDCF